MQVPQIPYDEYLRLNAESDERLEFYYGHIINMSGEQRAHRYVKDNLLQQLHAQQREGCRAFGEGTSVAAPGYGRGTYAYPDIFMVCGEEQTDDSVNLPIVTNPLLVVEVASESTRSRDLGDKAEAYFRNESLAEYWVIDTDHVQVVRHTRLTEGSANTVRYPFYNLNDVLISEALGIRIPLRAIYVGVFDA